LTNEPTPIRKRASAPEQPIPIYPTATVAPGPEPITFPQPLSPYIGVVRNDDDLQALAERFPFGIETFEKRIRQTVSQMLYSLMRCEELIDIVHMSPEQFDAFVARVTAEEEE
jgi:hypothetical protein